jgi:glycosyltransferase involved in cell wall biosynthesis
MRIAVNTRFLIPESLEGCGYFIQEVFAILTRKYPQHQFFFLFDRPFDPKMVFESNVTPIIIGPPARHPVLWKFWFDARVPFILSKIRADVFISPDGFASLFTRVPQCLVVHDLGFLHYPQGYKKSHLLYLKHYQPKFIRKAAKVATVSRFSKMDICSIYGTDPGKIDVVYNGVKEIYEPLGWDQKVAVKEQYTGGREFFLYVGAIQPRKNLVNLLKAFSFFKKRQQSGIRLVIAGRLAWKNEAFLKLLRTFKYKQDVILTHYLEEKELARLAASAYALVYPSFFEGFGVPVVEAMKCEVPVLTSKNSSMQEIAGEAALYFDPADPKDIAEAMMHIYKDETGREQLIRKGRGVVKQYSWQRTADALWTCIEAAIQSKQLP